MAKRKVYSHSRGKFVSIHVPFDKSWPGERWERVPDTIHRVYVSNYGRVFKEVHRNTKHTGWWTPISVRPIRTFNGWLVKVGTTNRYRKMLHLIVADLFQLRRPKIMVSFKDGNRWNARLSNLKTADDHWNAKLTKPQIELAKELFKIYPQQQIVSELADRFMVAYRTMWDEYKEFRNENARAGITTYEHLARNPFTGTSQRLLPRVPDLYLGQAGDLLRSLERPLGDDTSSHSTQSG